MWALAMGNGTGCDATPYFRVFNPSIQLKKLMKKVFILGSGFLNLNSWKAIDHAFAREELLQRIKQDSKVIYYNITVSVLNLFHVL
jgi:2-hydroxy-3-keto-5-methylthiopentenyl-1-phosphate phosphatase